MAKFLWKPSSRPPKHSNTIIVAFKTEEPDTFALGKYFVGFTTYDGEWKKVPLMWSNVPELPEPILVEPRNPSIPIPKPPSY